MKKYVTQQVEVTRECAYCDYSCDYQGAVIVKWGMADHWTCPEHGDFYEIDSPLVNRGYQIR
jgi:hypothetical protein